MMQHKSPSRFYRKFRDHQRSIQTDGGGCLTTFPSGRTEMSYASAPYGEHALSAFRASKRHAAFIERTRRSA